jgi:uncharacterized protein (DUF302 family)
VALVQPDAAPGVLSTASPFSVDDTIDRLHATIHARGLTLFAHIDHGGNAERVGLAMQPAHLLIFGNPRIGTPLMVASPLLAIDLPLKALVWQDQDGQTWVSYNSIPYLAARHALSPDLSQTLVRVEDLVAAALL